MPKSVFELTPDGYFARGRGRVTPVGVNYWPASRGVEMWRMWPAAEIQRDLDLTRALGLNCVRFFLRWEDFEPQPGRYDPACFAGSRSCSAVAGRAGCSRIRRCSSTG